jgi:hypothetical protein
MRTRNESESTDLRVPAGPFVAWFRARWPSAEAAAAAMDLEPRLVRFWLSGSGAVRGINLRFVDHALTRTGFLLHDVYDHELYPELFE